MLGNLGPIEIVIVLVIALMVLGPKRLPEAARSLGRGVREFRDSISPERQLDSRSNATDAPDARGR